MAFCADLRRTVHTRRNTAQRDVMIQRNPVADFSRFTDHHTGAVVNHEAVADQRARVNFNPRQQPTKLRDHPADEL